MPRHTGKPVDTRTRKFQLEGITNSINEELDPIRGSTFGINLQLSTTTQGVVLSAPTGKTLHLDSFIFNNESGATGATTIYDSTNEDTPVFKITAGANETVVLAGMVGLTFTTGIYVIQGSTFIGTYTAGVIERDT